MSAVPVSLPSVSSEPALSAAQPPAADPTAEAQAATNFANLEAKHDIGQPKAEEAPQGEVSDDKKPVAAEGDGKTKTEPEKSKDPDGEKPVIEPKDFEKAVRALTRDNVPRELIESMAENDPAKLVEWGKNAAKRQSDVDSYRKPKTETTPETPAGEPKTKVDLEPLAYDPDGELKKVEDLVSPEFAAPFKSLFSATHKQLKDVGGQVKEVGSKADFVLDRMERLEVKLARASLSKDEALADLADDDAFKRVEQEMRVRAKTGQYDDVEALMRDSAKAVMAEHSLLDWQKTLLDRHQKRRSGQPTSPQKREIGRRLSPEQEEQRKFRELEKKHGYPD